MAEMPPEMEFQWRRPQTFVPLAVAATTSPRAFFAAMPKDAGWLPPLAFLLVAQVVPALVQTLFQLPQHGAKVFGLMALSLANALATYLVATVVLWLVARVAFRAEIALQGVLRIFCYTSGIWVISMAVAVMSPVTSALVLVILMLVQLYLVQVGLQVVGKLPTVHAILSLLMAIVALVMLRVFLEPVLGPPTPKLPPPGAVEGPAVGGQP